MNKSIVVSRNSAWSVLNFHSDLLHALAREGFNIHIIAEADGYEKKINSLGFQFHHIDLKSRNINPIKECIAFIRFLILLHRIKPIFFLAFTMRPNVFGSIACKLLGINYINNITGMGKAFNSKKNLPYIMSIFLRFSLSQSKFIFFQNSNDLATFYKLKIITDFSKAHILPGSGVNLKRFHKLQKSSKLESFNFTFIGRLVWQKGIEEFILSAKQTKRDLPNARFFVIGPLTHEPGEVPLEYLKEAEALGQIEYLGEFSDVTDAFKFTDCIVLPSYNEGLPKVLIEAAACEVPIIASDIPGCNSVIMDGVDGFLFKAKNIEDLSVSMKKMYFLPEIERNEFKSRLSEKAKNQFDVDIVIENYLNKISDYI